MTGRSATRVAGQEGLFGAGLEGCPGIDGVDHVAAQRLWVALGRARADYVPQVLAAAEEAVFRFYLPLARSLAAAAGDTSPVVDREGFVQAAELGLAQAVLGWRAPDPEGFEGYARMAITARLRQYPAASGRIDPVPASPVPARSPGRDDGVAPGGHHHGSAIAGNRNDR